MKFMAGAVHVLQKSIDLSVVHESFRNKRQLFVPATTFLGECPILLIVLSFVHRWILSVILKNVYGNTSTAPRGLRKDVDETFCKLQLPIAGRFFLLGLGAEKPKSEKRE